MCIDKSIEETLEVVDSISFRYVHDEHEVLLVFENIANERFPILVIIHTVSSHFSHEQWLIDPQFPRLPTLFKKRRIEILNIIHIYL